MKNLAATALLWTGLLLAQSAAGQGMVHLKVDGVPGDSMVAGFVGWHPVLSWQVTEARPAGDLRSTFEPLTITKFLGSRSPLFAALAGSGQPIKEVILDVRRSTMPTVPLFGIVLRDVVVRSHSLSGSPGSTSSTQSATETLSFGYGRIEWSYYPLSPDGTSGTPVSTRWDVVNNKAY